MPSNEFVCESCKPKFPHHRHYRSGSQEYTCAGCGNKAKQIYTDRPPRVVGKNWDDRDGAPPAIGTMYGVSVGQGGQLEPHFSVPIVDVRDDGFTIDLGRGEVYDCGSSSTDA